MSSDHEEHYSTSDSEAPFSEVRESNLSAGSSGDERHRRLFEGTCADAESFCNRNEAFQYCGQWKINSGNCKVDLSTADACLLSPNFPKEYAANDACDISINRTKHRPIKAAAWSFGAGDKLIIDGVDFS